MAGKKLDDLLKRHLANTVALYQVKKRWLTWHASWFRKGGIKATWGSDLPPSWGHGGDCSPINPSLLYYFQIIFKWLKSLR